MSEETLLKEMNECHWIEISVAELCRFYLITEGIDLDPSALNFEEEEIIKLNEDGKATMCRTGQRESLFDTSDPTQFIALCEWASDRE